MVLPSFIIGGAPRSGTTYLYELCDAHPEILMARPRVPEPKFFLVDEEYRKGLAYYSEKYFSRAGGSLARGEKSTNYLENSLVARRIHDDLPEVKLVFVLRNPVERAFSNYLWSRKNGIETLSFTAALAAEKEREAKYETRYKYARPYSYVSRGMYAKQLKAYFDLFHPDQIRIVLFADLVSQPERTAQDLYRFLGVRWLPIPFDFNRVVNSARQRNDRMAKPEYEFLREVYARPNQELAVLIRRDLGHWDRAWSVER